MLLEFIIIPAVCIWSILGTCHAGYRLDMQIEIPDIKKYIIVLFLEGPLVWIGVPFVHLVAWCVDLFMIKVCPLFKKFEDWYQEK